MRFVTRILLFTLALLATAPAFAQRLEIIELQYRPVAEVLPLLRPFLAEGGSMSGQRGQLFVRTTPENLAELRRLLTSIDRPAKQLLITVLQGEGLKLAENEAELNARFGVGGHGGVVAGQPGTGKESIQLRLRSTRSRQRGEDVQRVRVMEGGTATIYVGQAIPLGTRSTTKTPWGKQTTDSIEYRNVTSGFTVIPRLSGDRVTLDIAARRDSPASSGGGRFDVQGIQTSVSGKLGEWIALGGETSTESSRNSGIIYRSTHDEETRGRILIRVEKLE